MYKVNLSFYIAKRYLLGKKSQNAINIISGIAVLGITTGTMALVIVLSVFNGFDSVVKSLYNTFDPDIQISAKEGKTFSPDPATTQAVLSLPGVFALSEVLEGNVLLLYNERQHIATVKGVDEAFRDVSGLDSMIYDGEMKLKDRNRAYAVVGQGVAYSLGIGLSFIDPLFIYTIDRKARINMSQPEESIRRDFIYPSGIFAIEQEYDSRYIICPIEYVRELLSYQEEVTHLEVKLDPLFPAEEVQKEIMTLMGEGFHVKNREQQNELFYRVMKTEKWAIFLILTFILIIASFNIIGSLSMLIIDKKKDILTLRNMGAGTKLIKQIFLVEGWLISVLGSVTGLFLGTAISWIQQRFGVIKLTGSGSFIIDAYPVQIEVIDICLIWVTVLFIGLIAAKYPVQQISKKYLASIEKGTIV
ncbi:MAG: FtsX-like permease family protein [Bacteroidales bacterium]|nr:FtsX-like permease family protein [Bacteroidales bacterium]